MNMAHLQPYTIAHFVAGRASFWYKEGITGDQSECCQFKGRRYMWDDCYFV